MKARSKRYAAVLSVVTVLALALSLVAMPAPSFAATTTARTSAFPDVKASDPYATAFNVLAALGVYQGDQNGNANPSQQITRAEAATVAVRLAGYASTAAALQNQTPSFKDAAQIPSWAWGAINAATTIGIINGYPDGTFRANNPVTQAEMLAMITRVLGNQGGVVGPWPTNYVAYATQAGLLNGISNPSANIPATRADVAFMAYNALGVAKKWDSSTNSFDKDFAGLPLFYVSNSGQTQLVSNPTSYAAAKGWVVKGTVQSISPTSVTLTNVTGAKTAAQLTLSLANVVNVSGAADLAGLVGQTVSFYGNTTDSSGNLVVAAAAPSASQAVTSGTLNDFAISGSVGSSLQLDSATYGIAESFGGTTSYSVNGQPVANAVYFNDLYGAAEGPVTASITLDSSNHVLSVSAWIPSLASMLQSVSPAANSASNNTVKAGGNTYVVDNAVLTLDGKTATVTDIQTAQNNFQSKYGSSTGALAIVYAEPSGTSFSTTLAARVDVYDTVQSGTVDGYGQDTNGQYVVLNYGGSDHTIYYSSFGTATVNPGGVGGTLTILVDGNGDAFASLGTAVTATETWAQLTSVVTNSSGTTATFTQADGSTVTTT
ncbi:MAG: S-layer homology domain-containing protein, partial [Bacillota bacterium]|nr:S-layer homology domain-containing protein [Bacillota bacterium]